LLPILSFAAVLPRDNIEPEEDKRKIGKLFGDTMNDVSEKVDETKKQFDSIKQDMEAKIAELEKEAMEKPQEIKRKVEEGLKKVKQEIGKILAEAKNELDIACDKVQHKLYLRAKEIQKNIVVPIEDKYDEVVETVKKATRDANYDLNENMTPIRNKVNNFF